jgi:hypothetical protein
MVQMIRELADYEKMLDRVQATDADLTAALFGPRPVAEALLADVEGAPVGFALFFATFSTFVGKPGIYLEGDVASHGELRGHFMASRLETALSSGLSLWQVV